MSGPQKLEGSCSILGIHPGKTIRNVCKDLALRVFIKKKKKSVHDGTIYNSENWT